MENKTNILSFTFRYGHLFDTLNKKLVLISRWQITCKILEETTGEIRIKPV